MNLNMTPLAEGLTRMGARSTAYNQRRVFASRSVVWNYLKSLAPPEPDRAELAAARLAREIDDEICRELLRTIKRNARAKR